MMLAAAPDTRCFRDPIARWPGLDAQRVCAASGVAMEIDEDDVPVRPDMQAACEMLGYRLLCRWQTRAR